jgi:hypothetical protein
MADDLLTRVRAELRQRLDELRPLVAEHDRLESVLIALDGGREANGPSRPATRRGTRRRRASSVRGGRQGRERAPRGANREAILRTIGERPGASAAEISAASGVQRNVTYATLRTLAAQGDVTKRELPGGQAGYRRA